jgi:hypothetical protein
MHSTAIPYVCLLTLYLIHLYVTLIAACGIGAAAAAAAAAGDAVACISDLL